MDRRIPLLDLKPQYATIRDEVRVAIDRVLESQQFVLGPEVEAFEREIGDYVGARNAIAVSSGTDALLLALMSLGVGPGDDVITSPFSFFATAGAIARLGARPVFADIDPCTFNLDARAALDRVTPATRAILPVHLYGRCAEVEPLVRAATDRAGFAVVEDAAQAIGAADAQGRRAGAIGSIGCFSFFPTKNLGAFGEGGLVTAADDAVGERVRILRVHGMEPKYHHPMVGGNFRLEALQAAVLRVKLRHLDAWTRARRRNADLYRALIREAGIDEVAMPEDTMGHVYNQFIIRARRRDELRESLTRRGIGTEVYYPIPLHLQECFRPLGYAPGDFPAAEAAAREVLALPIYAELEEAQIATVVSAIAEFYLERPPA